MSRLIINEKDPTILEKPSDKLKQKQYKKKKRIKKHAQCAYKYLYSQNVLKFTEIYGRIRIVGAIRC